MKKLLILIIAIGFLSGFAVADRGITPVPETQGIATSTSTNAVGNFASATELQWRITNDVLGLAGVPPLAEGDGPEYGWGATIYESTYTEDTQSNGLGLVLYDKGMDVETSGQISGQWNIEATKQLAFVGIDAATVVSTDDIMVDGAGIAGFAREEYICPFASPWTTTASPEFCNRAQAGSSIDMTAVNVRTTTTDRFVMPSSDHPVELNHDIRVSELVTDVPSVGMASAYMDVLIQEGSIVQGAPVYNIMKERIEFTEETSADGAITLFEKLMHYDSVRTGIGQSVGPVP
jgi:hypothetical protein